MLYKRKIIDEISKYLFTDDVIVLHGARQVGKTHILYYLDEHLKDQGRVTHYIDLEDSRLVRTLDGGIDAFVSYLEEEGLDVQGTARQKNKKLFVFIDEIHYLANPSSLLKLVADHYKQLKLIVSGSSSFALKDKFQDSLVGRTVTFNIFNLSFTEFLLFRHYKFTQTKGRIKATSQKKIDELKSLYQEYVLYGGYPKIVLTRDVDKKEKYLQQIIDTYLKKDVRDLARVKDIDKFNKLLEVLSGQSGNLLNVVELSSTCQLAKQTVEHYLFILEQTYIIKILRPYSRNLRSELFKTPKIYFYDSGLLQLLWLKALPREIMGNVFETNIFAELTKKYSDQDVIRYWRTQDKKEIDFIVTAKPALLPIEAKLNFAQFSSTAIDYFKEKYGLEKYRVVGLRGEKQNSSFVYPWEL